MAVTQPCDAGCSAPSGLSPYFELRGRCKMQNDERDLLEVLRFELQFLEDGGYGRSPRTPQRRQFIFEDSLTCMNYDSKEHPDPCSHCVLMSLVPPDRHSVNVPCRHIPLNVSGETVHSLYQHANQNEIEDTVGGWLRAIIQSLESLSLTDANDARSRPAADASRACGA